ncbi:hypothetical protein TSAR_013075 [Trichomalopsis sarcophagae]|uniref:CCHC-type domain-containing protein n=1 Tax=Trichomalopsis sarcophagae TaxID=543379 RepID=A0A232FN13_9HYME|nr:hypothetical protein TSAR_013075 [Trichomalopsis sarcophagae]
MKSNMRGLRMAIVILSDELLEKGHIRVGLISCRIRKHVKVVRYHKCLGFGHWKDECNEVDRSNLCFKCGEVDHRMAEC